MNKILGLYLLLVFACHSKIQDLAKNIVNRQSFTEKEWNYFANFDLNSYKLFSVPNLGKFYIDKTSDMIKGTLAQGSIWELRGHNLINVFAKPGSVVIDAGAFVGSHTIAMSRAVGFSGRVLAFEPCLKICAECAANLAVNDCTNVELYHYALGDCEQDVEFSILEGGEALAHISGGVSKNLSKLVEYHELVHMRTIDSFNLNNVSIMKLDVEGRETDVLRGAIETIKRNRPVIFIESWIWRPVELEKLGYVVLNIEKSDWCGIPRK